MPITPFLHGERLSQRLGAS